MYKIPCIYVSLFTRVKRQVRESTFTDRTVRNMLLTLYNVLERKRKCLYFCILVHETAYDANCIFALTNYVN